MPLTTIIITVVAVGLVLWLINRFIPMQSQIKSILNGLVVIVLVLWLADDPRREVTPCAAETVADLPANVRQQGNAASLCRQEI